MMAGNDLDKLIAAWLDGRLDAEDSQALQGELRESATARSKFRQYAELDTRLRDIADTSGMLDSAQQILRAAKQLSRQASECSPADTARARQTESEVTLPPTRPNGGTLNAFSRLATWYTALAVGMLLAVSLFSYFKFTRQPVESPQQLVSAEEFEQVELPDGESIRKPPAPIATLASTEQALWKDSQIDVGQALYEGESIELQEGTARISVGFGAEIIASAPCSMTFLASDRVELHEGDVAVDVAPWAKGFTVVTEEMDVVDLGTTFTVSASPGIKSEAAVLKGVVRVRPSKVQEDRRRGLLVTEGQRVSVDDTGWLTNMVQVESLQLLNRLDFGGAGPYRPVNLNNTGLGLAVGDEDQHWRVTDGPKESFSGPQFATVCVPHKAYLPNEPQKSQWVSIVDWQTAKSNSTYTFQTEFDLEGYDLSTMQLFGRFLADNGVSAVRVNGHPVQVQSWVDNVKYQPFGHLQFRFVNVTEGLVEGRNLIEVDVRNGMQRKWFDGSAKLSAIPNPMALRVEWYAFGRQYSLAKNSENAKLFRRIHQYESPVLMLSRRGPQI